MNGAEQGTSPSRGACVNVVQLAQARLRDRPGAMTAQSTSIQMPALLARIVPAELSRRLMDLRVAPCASGTSSLTVDLTALTVQLDNSLCLVVVNAFSALNIGTTMESRSAFHVPGASMKAGRAQNLVQIVPPIQPACQVVIVNSAVPARHLRRATPSVPRLVSEHRQERTEPSVS